MVGYDQPQHGLAYELQGCVMKAAGLFLGARRNPLMGPGAVRDGAFQQTTVLELVAEDFFKLLQVRVSGSVLFHNAEDCSMRKPRG